MIAGLLPAEVKVVEARPADWTGELMGSEANEVRSAIEKRQREFRAGRSCARRALRDLGFPAAPIPVGDMRQPIWPDGIVGSITHCDGYCAAAVATDTTAISLGIDAESNVPVADHVSSLVLTANDVFEGTPDPGVAPTMVAFSAKEALFKAWFPLNGIWLDFDDVEVRVTPVALHFTVLKNPLPRFERITYRGEWSHSTDRVYTAVLASEQSSAGPG